MITEVSSGIAQGHDFRVRGGIAVGEVAVPSAADDDAVTHDDGSYGNLTCFKGALGAAQGLFHPELVGRICVGAGFVHSKECQSSF
jgi:hypothetical protein